MSSAARELLQAWWSWIAPLSVQFALLALLFGLLDRCLPRRVPTRVRAALGWALLLRVALPPGIGSPVGIVEVLGERAPALAELGSPRQAWMAPIFLAWLVGLVLAGASVVRASIRERRSCLRDGGLAPRAIERLAFAAARDLGLARNARVLVSASASGPAAVGLLRPCIVLPRELVVSGSSELLRHVLLHETAHVARRDALAALAWQIACVVLWFHPGVHLAARRAATLREIACDERAARAAGSREAYRRSLLDLIRARLPGRALLAVGFVPPQAQILARLEALGRPFGPSTRGERMAAGLCFLFLAVCCVPLAPRGMSGAPARLGELQGCLRQRLVVLSALYQHELGSVDVSGR